MTDWPPPGIDWYYADDWTCIEDLLELVRQSVELHEQAKAAKLRTPIRDFAGQWAWKEKGGDV